MNSTATSDKRKGKHLELTIRATNGEPWETDRFKGSDTVAEVIEKAVRHFVKKGVMAQGDYDLTLIVNGEGQPPLARGDTLHQAGVRRHAVLALIPRQPQVDG